MKVKIKVVQLCLLFVTPWTIPCQAPLCPCNSPGQNTGVGSCSLLQGVIEPRSPHWGWILYHLSHQGLLLLIRFSRVWLCATLWTAAFQVPLSMGFSRQEYWNGLSCPTWATRGDCYRSIGKPASISISVTQNGSQILLTCVTHSACSTNSICHFRGECQRLFLQDNSQNEITE